MNYAVKKRVNSPPRAIDHPKDLKSVYTTSRKGARRSREYNCLVLSRCGSAFGVCELTAASDLIGCGVMPARGWNPCVTVSYHHLAGREPYPDGTGIERPILTLVVPAGQLAPYQDDSRRVEGY